VPTYEYECRSCGHRMEVIHSMTADGPSACERCGGSLRRVLYPTGIIFKGAGFYKTDSRASAAPSGGAAGSTDGGSKGGAESTPAPGAGPKPESPGASAPSGSTSGSDASNA
jgi:putative FmdB family regulatory protein